MSGSNKSQEEKLKSIKDTGSGQEVMFCVGGFGRLL